MTYDDELINLLSNANLALGKLDGITQTLPNPDLFVSMYVQKEALLSSQIEGTQASLVELLEAGGKQSEDVLEVTNYVSALNHGLKRLREDNFPLSLRLLREIHGELLKTGRGSNSTPGLFRTSQNWIGGIGSTPQTAVFVPPAVDDMTQSLKDLEDFLNKEDDLPVLIKIALIHAQFETIHPFLDGNGRMGRLLITLLLCEEGLLTQPLLYLSYYFKRNRREYFDRLMDVRFKGNWEEWLKFFLKGVIEISVESANSSKEIDMLRETLTKKVSQFDPQIASNAIKLLNQLFITPQVSRQSITNLLNISYPTASNLINKFSNELNILVDVTPDRSRNKKFLFQEYMTILEQGTL